MKLSKLRKIHIIIIGSVVWVLLGVGLFFVLIKPANEALAKEKARYDANYPGSTPAMAAQAERNLQQAQLEVANIQTTFNTVLDQKMPNLRFDDRGQGMLQLWHEQVEVLGPLLERFIRSSGVTLLSDIKIPAPPVNPNDPLFSLDYFPVSIGTISVRGNFKDILSHIKKWNSCNRLVQIDLPSLEGPSPTLTSSYNLTVYIFPRKTAKDVPEIKIAGAPGQAGAPGGGVTVGVPSPGAVMGNTPGPTGPGTMPMGPMGPGPMP